MLGSTGTKNAQIVDLMKWLNYCRNIGLQQHLTGTPAIFTAIARGDCEIFEISGEALRQVLNQCAGLSDIILQAFTARRQLLRESPNFDREILKSGR